MNIVQEIVADQIVQACWIVRHLIKVKPVMLNKFNGLLFRALNPIADNVLFVCENAENDEIVRSKIKDIYCLLTQPRNEEVYYEFSKLNSTDEASYNVITRTGWGAKCRIEFIQLIENTKYPRKLGKRWVKSMQLQFKFYFKEEINRFLEIGEERNKHLALASV